MTNKNFYKITISTQIETENKKGLVTFKNVKESYLVCASSPQDAEQILKNNLSSLYEYEIISITKTNFIDVFM